MSLGIKCFNCSGDTILDPTIMQTQACSGRHKGETTRGLFSSNDSPPAACQKCFVFRSQSRYLFINSIPFNFHVHTFSRPIKYSPPSYIIPALTQVSQSAVRSPQVWPQNKLHKQFSINTFDAKNILFTHLRTHLIINNYPCSRSLMHAYHLFLPLYK